MSNQDPWGGGKKPQSPPDLEQTLKRLFKKLQTGTGQGGNAPLDGDSNKSLFGVMLLIFVLLVALWAVSGFFIVDPAQKAVVLRFGKYHRTVGPGPHWIPKFIDRKYLVNTQAISTFRYNAQMLTRDENIVAVGIAIQFRVDNPHDYLFKVVNPQESLSQATASVLRQVVGNRKLDEVLTYGRTSIDMDARVRLDKQVEKLIKEALEVYRPGLLVTDVTIQYVKPPGDVIAAFDDAIKAREDQVRTEREAEADQKQYVLQAQGQAKRIAQEARAKQRELIASAQAEIASYLALLPQYKSTPKLIRERLYLYTLQSVLANSSKILLDTKDSNNVMYLPLDKILQERNQAQTSQKTQPQTQMNITVPNIVSAPELSTRPSREEGGRDSYQGRGV